MTIQNKDETLTEFFFFNAERDLKWSLTNKSFRDRVTPSEHQLLIPIYKETMTIQF